MWELKFLEENIGINLCDLGFDNGCLDMTPKHKQQKKKTHTLNLIKILNFSASKDTIIKWKDNL